MVDYREIVAWILVVTLFVFLLATIWADSKGAPYLPTKRKKIRRMLELAQVKPGDTIYDLGCGDGRVLIMAARKYGAFGVGVEIHPFRYIWCQIKITILGLRRKIKIKFGDLFNHDIHDADVVFCYLLQSTNNQLEWKLHKELSHRARVVSNTFMFHTLPLIQVDKESEMYLYSGGIVP